MIKGRFIVVGGAGFIGSHFCDRLMAEPAVTGVTIYDNFTSGRDWHIAHHLSDPRFNVVRGDVTDLDGLTGAVAGHDVVIHLASNPDIARAATEPTIDFDQGTVLTMHVVEAMRRTGTPRILYASGSGVYGDTGRLTADETWSPMAPSSTYGASKLAGEALISSYVAMFDLTGLAFRFGNVVGARQTHGVGFDFVRRLRDDPTRLRILGDGEQTKSYIHVSDVVAGVLFLHEALPTGFDAFNLATGDTITVNQIADLACEVVGLSPDAVRYEHTGGDRGWKGDVPIVLLSVDKAKSKGWRGARPSRDAMRLALDALRAETIKGLI